MRSSAVPFSGSIQIHDCIEASNGAMLEAKNRSDKCKPLFGQTAFNSFSTRFIFAQLCANIIMVLAVSASPVFFWSASWRNLERPKCYLKEAIAKVNDCIFEELEVIQPHFEACQIRI